MTKPHNIHYLTRYCKFIKQCCRKNLHSVETLVAHHVCPKANDLFPEYAKLNNFSWNKALLTRRQHYIAHYLLWKSFKGSQTNAFYAMNNKNKYVGITSSTYSKLTTEANVRSSILNKGYAVYVDLYGNKIRCKTIDPRVLSGELTSTTLGRKFSPRSDISKQRTSVAVTGKNIGPMSINERISRRKKQVVVELYFDPLSNEFISVDPLLKPISFIKVFTGSRKVWDKNGNFRNISHEIPIPPGYFDVNPLKIIKGINLDNMYYIEVNYLNKPLNFHPLSTCKVGKRLVQCSTLNKKVYLPEEWISFFGLPINCSTI